MRTSSLAWILFGYLVVAMAGIVAPLERDDLTAGLLVFWIGGAALGLSLSAVWSWLDRGAVRQM